MFYVELLIVVAIQIIFRGVLNSKCVCNYKLCLTRTNEKKVVEIGAPIFPWKAHKKTKSRSWALPRDRQTDIEIGLLIGYSNGYL